MTRFPDPGLLDRRHAAASLVDVFRSRAQAQPDRVAFSFFVDDDQPTLDVSDAELDRRARAIAARLQQVARPGDRALLMFETGFDYVAALAGCLYAGVVAVPAYPPDPMRVTRQLPRLEAIIRDASATLLLGTSNDLAWAGAMLGSIPGLKSLIATNDIDSDLAEAWQTPSLDRDSLAFLQYTSGSTGDPKGVMIRHGAVLQNLAQMEATVDVEDAVVVMWLPAYHDMGLIGGILQCWYSGRRNVTISPAMFFQRPIRWLRAISDYRATTTGAPDFAYDLCVRKISNDDRRGLDLSSWRIALSGAEPVRPHTISRFVEAFAECGVRRDIFCPCFGLAEATLMVSCSNPLVAPVIRGFDSDHLSQGLAVVTQANDAGARMLVGCGHSVPGQRIAIVDPRSLVDLPPGQIGEIWVQGGNVAGGYWNRPEESTATFAAHTTSGDGPFLRTGDAGFIHDGQLFISGRLKDMLIVNGRNHYPQDIEQTVGRSHLALKSYGGAAFSVECDGRERVVLVHEVARPKKYDLDDVSRHMRWSALEAHDLLIDTVVLIRQGTIPKTTSGKIQRHACREQFLRDELQVLHAWNGPSHVTSSVARESYVAPRSAVEATLADAWAEVLGVPRVGVFDNFLELGGHSLLAAQLINRLGRQLDVEIPLAELFDRPTIAALAELIDAKRAARQETEQHFLSMLETMSEAETLAMLALAKDKPLTAGDIARHLVGPRDDRSGCRDHELPGNNVPLPVFDIGTTVELPSQSQHGRAS